MSRVQTHLGSFGYFFDRIYAGDDDAVARNYSFAQTPKKSAMAVNAILALLFECIRARLYNCIKRITCHNIVACVVAFHCSAHLPVFLATSISDNRHICTCQA